MERITNHPFKTLVGNMIFVAIICWIVGVDKLDGFSDVFFAQDYLLMFGASLASYTITAMIGWGNVWYGLVCALSEIPWYFWVLL